MIELQESPVPSRYASTSQCKITSAYLNIQLSVFFSGLGIKPKALNVLGKVFSFFLPFFPFLFLFFLYFFR